MQISRQHIFKIRYVQRSSKPWLFLNISLVPSTMTYPAHPSLCLLPEDLRVPHHSTLTTLTSASKPTHATWKTLNFSIDNHDE
jgi:hypothetical protein